MTSDTDALAGAVAGLTIGGITLLLILAGVFVLMLGIVWLLLPFALFGIKKRLDRIALALESPRYPPPAGTRLGDDIRIPDSARSMPHDNRHS